MMALAQRRWAAWAVLITAGVISVSLSLLANIKSGETHDATLEYLRLQNELGRAERVFVANPTVANETAVELRSSALPAVWGKIENSGEGLTSLLVASILALLAAGLAEAWKELIGRTQKPPSRILAALSLIVLAVSFALGIHGWFFV